MARAVDNAYESCQSEQLECTRTWAAVSIYKFRLDSCAYLENADLLTMSIELRILLNECEAQQARFHHSAVCFQRSLSDLVSTVKAVEKYNYVT